MLIQEPKRKQNQTIDLSTEWFTHKMIKLSFHICVQKRLIALTTTPKHIIFSTQIMCHLQYILIRKMNSGSENTIGLLMISCIHTNIPRWLSSLEQQHMHTPLIQSCKAFHFVSHEPNRHQDRINKPGGNGIHVT